MKAKKFTLLLFIALIIASCSLVDKLLTFTVSDSVSLKIENGFPVGIPYEFLTPEVTSNSSSEFENNNTKADLVKEVFLKDLKLTITDPADQNFSFLKSVRLYISTNANDEIELAYLDDINSTSNTLNLNVSPARLDKYVKSSSYRLRTKVITKESINKEISMKADIRFSVTADPF